MSTQFDEMQRKWQKSQAWPPPEVQHDWQRVSAYRMYYESDRQKLIISNPNLSISNHRVEIFVPVPWAREICRFSASLLFPQSPRVMSDYKEQAHTVVQANDFGSFVIEGGVQVAIQGRVGIRIIRDPSVGPYPLLTIVDDDKIIWHRKHGRFTIGGVVVVERILKDDSGDNYYRLLEDHTVGMVQRVLYKGEKGKLGKVVPLSTLPEFADLEPLAYTGLDTPTLIQWENVPGGESDLMALRALLDTYNEGESLLLDRARKAIPRVFVDRSLADETGRLTIDGYILVGGSRMRVPLGATAGTSINIVEPKFDAKEHIEWLDHLSQLLVTVAGYAPSTWGIQGKTANVSRVVSGYALKLTQLRTLLNRSAKEHMALQALGRSFALCLAWMAGNPTVEDFLPRIELGDGLPSDPLDGAQETLFLKQAQAASTETLIRIINPLMSPAEVEAELGRIQEEMAFAASVTAGAKAGLGPVPTEAQRLLALRKQGEAGDGGNDGAIGVD